MSFLKLCQISNESYIETADGEVILNNIEQFPQIFSVEIIHWESEDEFVKRGKVISFESVNVEVIEDSRQIRNGVYDALLVQYPNLIK